MNGERDRFPAPGDFDRPISPIGNGKCTIEVGGLSLQIAGASMALLDQLAERYSPFLANRPAAHEVILEAGENSYLHHVPGSLLRLEENRDQHGEVLVSHNFAARRTGNSGRLLLSAPEDVEDSLLAIENYLRWTLADMALDHGGFILHAAGLAKGGSAYLFFGPSGAGKSTIVSLSPGTSILSDDLVLVIRGESGWQAATTPFKGMFPQGAKDRAIYPLAGLFRLVQSPIVALSGLPMGLAVGMAMACCPFVSDPVKRHDKLMTLVENCCRETGVRELRFRRDSSFWKLIER